jgi:hypothetical protein
MNNVDFMFWCFAATLRFFLKRVQHNNQIIHFGGLDATKRITVMVLNNFNNAAATETLQSFNRGSTPALLRYKQRMAYVLFHVFRK